MLPNSARPAYTPYRCLPELRPLLLSLKRQIPVIPLPLCILTGMHLSYARPLYTPYPCLPELRSPPCAPEAAYTCYSPAFMSPHWYAPDSCRHVYTPYRCLPELRPYISHSRS